MPERVRGSGTATKLQAAEGVERERGGEETLREQAGDSPLRVEGEGGGGPAFAQHLRQHANYAIATDTDIVTNLGGNAVLGLGGTRSLMFEQNAP